MFIFLSGALCACICMVFFYFIFLKTRRRDNIRNGINNISRFLDTMPYMALIIDSENRIEEVVNFKEIIFPTLNPEDINNKKLFELAETDPDYTDSCRIIMEHVTRTRDLGRIFMSKYLQKTSKGNNWINVRTTMLDETHIVCYLHDITERVQRSQEIVSLKGFLKVILDNIPESVLVKDADDDFRYLFINEKMRSSFSQRNSVIGKNDFELGVELAEDYLKEDINVLNSDRPKFYDKTEFDENGVPVKWYTTIKKRISDNGHNYILAVETDVTESRKREYEYNNMRKELSIAIDAGDLKVWSYNTANKTYRIVNNVPASKEEYIKLDDMLSTIHPEDRDTYGQFIDSMTNGEMINGSITIRYMKKGRVIWIEKFASVVKNDITGKVSTIIGTEKDITKKKLREYEFIELREKAELANKQKSAFLANMSHEIRSPLTAIIGFSNLMIDAETKEEKEQYMQIVQSNNDLLLQLINDILDLSKIEAGTMDFNISEWKLNDMFNELEQVFSKRMNENVRFSKVIPQQEYIINSERNRITQVLTNFLNNSMKYTSSGEIELGFKIRENDIFFYVSDTGTGIKKENLDQVFTRFSKFNRSVPGNGLGLSICKMIIETLKGKIGFTSEEGKGSIFYFSFPLSVLVNDSIDKDIQKGCLPAESIEICIDGDAAPEDKTSVASTISDAPHEDSYNKNLTNLLVAEDNDSNYLLLSCMLRNKFNLFRAFNGIEAIIMHKKLNPSAILMDVRMPEMDGLTATRAIRDEGSDTPIIAITAHAFDEDRRKAIDAGCDAFLTKPVNSILLNSTLDEILNR